MPTPEEWFEWRRRFFTELTAVDSAVLLQRRARLLSERPGERTTSKPPPPTPATSGSLRADIESSAATLEILRTRFFQLNPNRLMTLLDKLRDSQSGVFLLAEQRLRVIAEHRETLQQICQTTDPSSPFLQSLPDILIGDPSIVGSAREQVFSALKDPKSLKIARRHVAMIRERCPSIYTLEQEWLEQLEHGTLNSFHSGIVLTDSDRLRLVLGLFLLAGILFGVVQWAIHGNSPRPRNVAPPPPPPQVIPISPLLLGVRPDTDRPPVRDFEYRPAQETGDERQDQPSQRTEATEE